MKKMDHYLKKDITKLITDGRYLKSVLSDLINNFGMCVWVHYLWVVTERFGRVSDGSKELARFPVTFYRRLEEIPLTTKTLKSSTLRAFLIVAISP